VPRCSGNSEISQLNQSNQTAIQCRHRRRTNSQIMLLNAMPGLGRPMLMAMRCGRVAGLREALRETMRVRHHQHDRKKDRKFAPPPHFSPA
jgi:hypothetical protein